MYPTAKNGKNSLEILPMFKSGCGKTTLSGKFK
jgi:hypothetical protein